MQKQTTNNKQQTTVSQTTNKETKTMKKTNNKQQPTIRLEDTIYNLVKEAQDKDNNIRVQKVTGYVSIKYGNTVLFEFHDKKKAISHLTFSTQQKIYELLKTNKLVLRVVPASYGWKYNTECLLTPEFSKQFPTILKSVITEAIERRNIKEAPKKPEKKVAKA